MIKVPIFFFKKIRTQRDEFFRAASRTEGRTDRHVKKKTVAFLNAVFRVL
jgi:hypothetical protein